MQRAGNLDIKLLVFDMGHVIIDFEWPLVCQGFLKRAGWDRLEDFQPILSKVGKLGYETGKINTSEFLAALNQLLSTDISEDEFTHLWNATFRENEDMALLLSNLKERYPLYLLSNTNENHFSFIEENFNVSRHFDELILSYELGCAKPDLLIYEETVRRGGLSPEQFLFVDDLKDNIDAATKVGMNTILFTNSQDLKQELKQLQLIS